MSLEEIKARLLAANKSAESLLAQVSDLYTQERRSEENVLTEALSELHNSGEIDFVKIVKRVDKSSCKNGFFSILHSFENVLPLLNSKVEDVLPCLFILRNRAVVMESMGPFSISVIWMHNVPKIALNLS